GRSILRIKGAGSGASADSGVSQVSGRLDSFYSGRGRSVSGSALVANALPEGGQHGTAAAVDAAPVLFDTRGRSLLGANLAAPEEAEDSRADEADESWKDMPDEPADAPSALAQASLEIDPSRKYTPSPESWEDEFVYSLVLDRFAREDPSSPWGDPAKNNTRHGGNIRGLVDQLDYIKDMGATAIHITPIMMNAPAAYHGYWPAHFLSVDPQLGTMAEFKSLVREAHKRGMRIILDMVFNHAGPVIEYKDGHKWVGMDGPPKEIKRWKYPIKPVEMADKQHFHRRGSLDDWDDPVQRQYGDFPGGLNQLATENPATQDMLIKIAKWWIKETDVDGFRLDTYQHIHPTFWTKFFNDVRGYAAELGKADFMLLGEIYHGDPGEFVSEMRPERLHHAFHYPAYFWDAAALHGEAPASTLEASLRASAAAIGDAVRGLVRFLDNQDKPRYLRRGDTVGMLRVAMAYVLFSIGVPFIYYGTEQAFRVTEKSDPELDDYREDMFAEGKFRSPGTEGDMYRKNSTVYRWVQMLSKVRKAFAPLRRGEQHVRWADRNGPGIYAFSRIHDGQEVVVILNTSRETRSAEMWVDAGISPVGTEFVDALDPSHSAKTYEPEGGGSKVWVEVPRHGVRVLVKRKT
ncbi:alpha-amylase family glycosyl hydrolase, partial [Elusimicrobiota bacterium]